MGKYVIEKLFGFVITFFLIVTITFIILRVIPGGPFDGEIQLSEQARHTLELNYCLDKPLWFQYGIYIKNLFHFDLGISYKKIGLSVTEMITNSFKYSAVIGLLSFIIATTTGIWLGIVAAIKRGQYIDRIITNFCVLGITVPNFILGATMIYLLGEKFHVISVVGGERLINYVTPIIVLSIYPASFITRLVRGSMIEILGQNYIKVSMAYGISRSKIIMKYALKNAIIPVITYVCPMLASILTGSFAIEKVYSIPGLGKLFIDSITNRDYTVVMGITIFYTLIYLTLMLLMDIVYAAVDPRVKVQRDN